MAYPKYFVPSTIGGGYSKTIAGLIEQLQDKVVAFPTSGTLLPGPSWQ